MLDIDLLLSSGAMTGPHRLSRPYTLPARKRLVLWVRQLVLGWRSPL
jgi:hypothetical protein